MQRNLEEQLKEHTKLSSSLKLLVINMNSGILVDVISSLSENKKTVLEDQLEERMKVSWICSNFLLRSHSVLVLSLIYLVVGFVDLV